MLSSTTIREITPFLTLIFLQILQFRAENDLDYSLESLSLLTTSEIAKEIMNQNLNSSCAGLRIFFNSEAYQDVEKILNMTRNSTEVNENRKEYHSRIKRCTEMEKQKSILHEFEKRNRKKELIGSFKSNRTHSKQKSSKDSNFHEATTYESFTNDDSEQDVNKDDFLKEDSPAFLKYSASTETYSRTYRTIAENLTKLTTNSASLETVAKDDQDSEQSNIKDEVQNESEILKENEYNITDSSTTPFPATSKMRPVQRKNTPKMGSTKASKSGEKKKGLLKSLLGDVRHVMEGGHLKSKNLSNFDPEEKKSHKDVSDEDRLLEYETVTPYEFVNSNHNDGSRNEQKITQNISKMDEETKKQLQLKIEELISIRKKLVEIVRFVNSTDIHYHGETDSKRDFVRHQTTSDPLTSLQPRHRNLKSKNLLGEQPTPSYLSSELPSLESHVLKHNFPKHEEHLNQHVSNSDSSQNREFQGSFSLARSQDIEMKKKDGDINPRAKSKVDEYFTRTPPSRSDSTMNKIHSIQHSTTPKNSYIEPNHARELPELKKGRPFQQEKSSTENAASFDRHSTKIKHETTSKDPISTQLYSSNRNSIFNSLNKIEDPSDTTEKSQQSIAKTFSTFSHHPVTLNPIFSTFLEKFAYPRLMNKLEKSRKNITSEKRHSDELSTLYAVNSNKDSFSKTTSPQKPDIDDNNPFSLHHHSHQSNLDQISTLQPHPGHQHFKPSYLDSISAIKPSQSSEVSLKGVNLPTRSHFENQMIPPSIHHHSEKISPLHSTEGTTLPQIFREDDISNSHMAHSHPYSKHSNEIPKGVILPQKSQVENHSILQPVHHHHHHSTLPPSSPFETPISAILPQQYHEESRSIPHTVHQHHPNSELPHFGKATIHQQAHLPQTSIREIPEKSNGEMNTNSHGQFEHFDEISPLLNHLISQIGHQHAHPYNQDKIFSHTPSHSTEASSKSPRIQSLITKLPGLYSEEKILHSTPSPLHFSTIQTKTLQHPNIDNATLGAVEAMKRLEKMKIEEIKNLKIQLEALHKNRIVNPSQQTLPYFDESYKQSTNKIHVTDGTPPHTPKTLKHEAQVRSGSEQDIKIYQSHDITKPYPISFTTLPILQNDLDVLGKMSKPLPPLNPNDNWKYASKLDNYYEKQNRQSTTPQPRTIRPIAISTPKPRPLITPSSTIAPTTTPRVRPSIRFRNTTNGQNKPSSSTTAPPTQRSPPPVNYNINSTINRNFNITFNFVPPNSGPQENNEVNEGQREDNASPNEPVSGDESDQFNYLVQPKEASNQSNEGPAEDFDNPPHPTLPRQSSPELSNLPSLNKAIQLPTSTTTSIQIENNEPIPLLRTQITPSDDSFRTSYTFENEDTISQSPTRSTTKSSDSSTTATKPYQEIIKNLKNLTLKVQSQPHFENVDYSATQPSTTLSDKTFPLLTQTISVDANQTPKSCNNIIIIPNKTEEIMGILRLMNFINANNDEPPSTDTSTIPLSPKSVQVDLAQSHSNPFSEIKTLLGSIQKLKITPSETIELHKSINDLLAVLKQRRNDEYHRLYLSRTNPMVGDGRDSILAITQINEYIELLELMTVYLARDPDNLLDKINDARMDNFESTYPQDDPQRRLIEDQFYFIHPTILNEFIDVYKKYSKEESYFGKPAWQFSQENGPRSASRQRFSASPLNNLFNFKELIPALTYNTAPMYRPGIQYEDY